MSRKSTRTTQLALRRLRVLEMRKAGINFSVIAKETGISATQVIRDYKRALDEAACGRLITLHSERSLELQRLEIALLSLNKKVRKGDMAAIDRWLRLCESRRRLLGLNRKPGRTAKSGKSLSDTLKTYVNLDLEKV